MAQATKTELQVRRREVLGKKVKRLRREGLTPANIYGHHVESLAVQMPTDDLRQVLKEAGRNELVYLHLDGDERPTFVKDVQRNPVSDAILHVDFLQISLREKVKMEVTIRLVGLAPAVDRYGGILMHGLDHVTVEALPADVPSAIEVDVSELEEIDASLHVSDLRVPEGVVVLTDPEQVVAKVAPPAVERVAEEEAAAAEEAAAEEAAAAEGAAPAEEASE
ncbi:MAG: 50S ribosomal protein L25 [Dehalococcoidia bacterium]|nr:50S ribosomal protein L25 [Dehalococcoidia bacterium]